MSRTSAIVVYLYQGLCTDVSDLIAEFDLTSRVASTYLCNWRFASNPANWCHFRSPQADSGANTQRRTMAISAWALMQPKLPSADALVAEWSMVRSVAERLVRNLETYASGAAETPVARNRRPEPAPVWEESPYPPLITYPVGAVHLAPRLAYPMPWWPEADKQAA